jgi:hypothetical protein
MIRTFTACTLVCLLTFSESLTAQQLATTAAQAKPADAATPEPPRAPLPNTLMDGTAIKVRLAETISSADAKMGEQVPFEVTEDVVVQGVTVIPKGSPALATVTDAESKKRMGRGGKLNVNIDSVRLADGEKAQLRAVKDSKGGGHVGAMTGAMVATAIVFFPAAPLFLFMKGKDITIPKGTEVTAFVQGDMKLDMAKFVAAPVGPAAAPASSMASVSVESNVSGADIEVDGNFVGNTPSKVEVTPGSHAITVKKKGYQSWTRTMNVSGTGAKVNAELEEKVAGTK